MKMNDDQKVTYFNENINSLLDSMENDTISFIGEVKNNFEPLGAIVGQKPHATALAFLEKNLFTRPKTAFPSCKTTLKRKIFAARIVGNVGYPPKPTTTLGLWMISKYDE